MSLFGIAGKPYIDLSDHIDLSGYDKLHPIICKNLIEAKDHMYVGTLHAPKDFLRLGEHEGTLKTLVSVHHDFLQLPDDDPVKVNGLNFQDNDLAAYLKYALGGYDPYSFYLLYDFKKNWRDDINVNGELECIKYFPELMSWVRSLIDKEVFSHIGRVVFFLIEHGGISIQHAHRGFPYGDNLYPEFSEEPCEFIHIQNNAGRKFFVADENNNKTYINSRVSWFNDKDWHGGDPVTQSVYALRIDGVFTQQFKHKICP